MQWLKSTASTTNKRAVAYYRHSAQDRQENSVEIQQDQVRAFAAQHGIEIIREFADRGKSGLSTEDRHEFNEMIHGYVEEGKADFQYVLVLDVSRWGRFQDTDMSAYYTGLCAIHGAQVVFTSIGFPKNDDLLHGLHVSIERYRAASYSRELSTKVFKGCVKIAEQGFRAGGSPPYGLHRLLLDEKRNPVQVLNAGQRKSIQNQRVTLAPGDEAQVRVIKLIFSMFISKGRSPKEIAERLNRSGAASRGGASWTGNSVLSVLTNEMYAGTIVYNRTTQRLKARRTDVPRDEWIRTADSFTGIVSKEDFQTAAEIMATREEERVRRYSDVDMAQRLGALFERYGTINAKLISASPEMVSAAAYSRRYRSLDMAFNHAFQNVIDARREEVVQAIKAQVKRVESYDGFVVLDDYVSLHVQPAVPFPLGYDACWAFRPVMNAEVDITLGVPLANGGTYAILGYLLFVRLLCPDRTLRFTSTATDRFAFHCYELPELINLLLETEKCHGQQSSPDVQA